MYNTGIDVSEHNGEIDWEEIRRAGIAFAIIRLGWGRGHLDRLFYEHINGALAAGLAVGVYYYSYADTPKAAEDEAWFTVHVLADCGLSPEKLPLGVWYDMEDADGWKAARGLVEPSRITAMCGAYVDSLKSAGYLAGVYASYDWLTRMIFPERASSWPFWCAQWGRTCDFPEAFLWQYTDQLDIGGHLFDGDRLLGGEIHGRLARSLYGKVLPDREMAEALPPFLTEPCTD